MSAAIRWLQLSLWLLTAVAEVREFDPFRDFEGANQPGDIGRDILVLVHPPTNLGRAPIFKALEALEEENSRNNLNRARPLLISMCKGCWNYHQVLSHWYVEEADLPVAMILPNRREDDEKGRFRLNLKGVEDPLTAMKGFLQRFDAGELKPHVLSAPVPSAEEQGDYVREVVGTTFDEEVMDSNHSVMMLFYRPWCGYCKMVQPDFRLVAKRLALAGHLIRIARMDVDRNSVSPRVKVHIDGVPKIALFIAGRKHAPETHHDHGNRTLPSFLAWARPLVPGLEAWMDDPNSTIARAPAAEDGLLGGEEDQEF